MSPRLRVWGACRALAVRSRPVAPRPEPFYNVQLCRSRFYADDAKPPSASPSESLNKAEQEPKPEATTAQAASVPVPDDELRSSQEAVKEIVEEVSAEADADSHIRHLDDAALEEMLYGVRVAPTETQGGLTPAQEEALYSEGTIVPPAEAEALVSAESDEVPAPGSDTEVAALGHKFAMPSRPYPEGFNLKKRYHPVLEQITRLMMRDGKLSVAQRNMSLVMNYLRTAPAPMYSPKFPLLPGTPPASHLPLNPVLYLTIAIDSVAPLVKVRHMAGAGGGGRSLDMPMPLKVRQRRRVAFQWILNVVDKKPSKGSGRKQFPYRIAEEIVAVIEGRSSVWEKRTLVHKMGTASRANVNSTKFKKR